VRARLPEVLVPELPADPVFYASFLESSTDFDTLRLTDEDRARGAMYAAEKQRRDVQQSVGDLESYLRTLATVVEVHRVRPGELARAHQLMQKTNQFNTTTLRWTMPELTAFLESEDRRVHTAHVSDRFGDSGLVGLCLSTRQGSAVEIVGFLLSCRVLGRGVEDAFLRAVLAQWRADGVREASGRVSFTAKNVPVRELFAKNGCEATS
jgi:FkbH-like protein